MKRGVTGLAVAGGGVAAGGWWLFRPRPSGVAPGTTAIIDGEAIHYIDAGQGAPIVLIHGFLGSTFSWRGLLPLLMEERHSVVALDLPGFGFSDRGRHLDYSHAAHARRVLRLMDELGLDRAVLAGHSMGGGIAQRVAATAPERVERLVLVGSVDGSETLHRGRRPPAWTFSAAGVVARSPLIMDFLAGRALRDMYTDPKLVTPQLVRGYVDPLLRPGTVGAIRAMAEANWSETPVDLPAIATPALVLSGENDRVCPPSTGERIAGALGNSQHVIIERTGHLLAEERPEEVLRALRSFITAPVSA